MRNPILVFFLVLFLMSSMFISTAKSKTEEFYTKEGVILQTNSGKEVNILLQTGESYAICGILLSELRQLSNMRVMVSGMIGIEDATDSTGYYNILRYTILEDGLIGNIRQSGAGILLIGEDQVIYSINVPAKLPELRELVDCKVFMRCTKEKHTEYTGFVNAITEIIVLRQLDPGQAGQYVTLEGEAYLDGSEPLLELVLRTEEGLYFLDKLYNIGYLNNVVVTGLWIKNFYPYYKGTIQVEQYSLKTLAPHGTLFFVNGQFVLLGDNQIVYRILNPPSSYVDLISELPTLAILSGKVEKISEFEATLDVGSTNFPGRYYFNH